MAPPPPALASTFNLSRPNKQSSRPQSVRLGNVAVHIEVAGDLGQRELDAVQFLGQDDLAPQTGVLLQHGSHVQHVILPAHNNNTVKWQFFTFT